MVKVLLVGSCPLPDEDVKINPAAGIRTQQFLDALKAVEGVDLRVVKIAMPECYEKAPKYRVDGNVITISKDETALVDKIQKIHDDFEPDVLISVNTYPSFIAASLVSRAAFWADLNGWVMAEAQAQAYKLDSDAYLSHYLKMERKILMKADKISTVSKAQSQAVLGELAMLGRLNNANFDHVFTVNVPNCLQPAKLSQKNFKGLPKNSFLLLWLGGYNTWVDENTLFEGVESAMEKCEKLFFVSTGGRLNGLDTKTFEKFQSSIEKSKYKDRFIFLGWLKKEEIADLLNSVDAGINVDRYCVETLTGARNRINEFMNHGIPVVSTLGSEISYEMAAYGAGLGVASGDYRDLAEKIADLYLDWADQASKLQKMGQLGRSYIEDRCDAEKNLQSLIDWVKVPEKAAKASEVGMIGKIGAGLQYFKENGLKKTLKKLRANW